MIDLTKYGMNEIRQMRCIVVPSCRRCGFFDATSESCECTNQFVKDKECPYSTVEDVMKSLAKNVYLDILKGGMGMSRKEELIIEINELIREENELATKNPKVDVLLEEYRELLREDVKILFGDR